MRNIDVKSVHCDGEDCTISMEAEVQDSLFLFYDVYSPNKVQDQCFFLDRLNKIVNNLVINKDQRINLTGDVNVTYDSDLDCSQAAKHQRKILLSMYSTRVMPILRFSRHLVSAKSRIKVFYMEAKRVLSLREGL